MPSHPAYEIGLIGEYVPFHTVLVSRNLLYQFGFSCYRLLPRICIRLSFSPTCRHYFLRRHSQTIEYDILVLRLGLLGPDICEDLGPCFESFAPRTPRMARGFKARNTTAKKLQMAFPFARRSCRNTRIPRSRSVVRCRNLPGVCCSRRESPYLYVRAPSEILIFI